MNAFSAAGKNVMLDAWAALYDTASLHTAFPGDTGASEVVGGTYTREAITWAAAAGGSLDNSANPTFDVPAGTTIAFLGFWDALAGVDYGGWAPIAGGAHTPFEATASDDVFRADQHGYADGTRVILLDTTGAVLPGGFVEGTIYFVRDATTDTFKLAATSGGAAIDVTADGAGFVLSLIPETYGSAGTYTTTDVDLDLLR